MLTRYTTFLSGSEADSREELAGASLCAGTLTSTKCSVNYSSQSGTQQVSPYRLDVLIFVFVRFLLVLATSLFMLGCWYSHFDVFLDVM